MPGVLISTLSFRKAVGLRSPDMIHRSHSDSALYSLYQLDSINNGIFHPYSIGNQGSSPASPLVRRNSYPCTPQSVSSSPFHSDDNDGDDDEDSDVDDEVFEYYVDADDDDEDYDGDDEEEIDDHIASFLGQWRNPSPPPCILGSRRDELVPDLFRFKTETTRYLEPETFCQVHRRFAILRLDDVRFQEDYTRVVEGRHGSSFSRVTHRYMDCILVFPSRDKLISSRRDRPSTSNPPDPILERLCGQCGVPVGGAYDPSFFRYDLFCSNKCCYERTLDEQQFPEIEDSKENDKGKGVLYIG